VSGPSGDAHDARAVRVELLAAAREMLRSGLVTGTAGNLAARLPDGNVLLTPSSLDYDEMTDDDLVVCDLDGTVVAGDRSPTTEKDLHLATMRLHRDVGATMHCHAKHCTMFAIVRQPIPAVVEEFVLYVGGDVECADYRTTGTAELGEEVAKRLADRSAVLMANHGLFAVGRDARDALRIAHLVERTAEIVWGARLLGDVVPVPDDVNRNFAEVYRLRRSGAL
jgi:L-fuculose-phosphate aldolase